MKQRIKERFKQFLDRAEIMGYTIMGAFSYGVDKGIDLRKKTGHKMNK